MIVETVTLKRSRRHSAAWWVIVVLSWLIVLYGALFLILRERIFTPELADSFKARPWGIYPHVIVGMLGLALGPLQFHPRIQMRAALHRKIGTTYVVIAMLVGVVGLYMAWYSFGGMITHLGFALLAIGVLLTTSVGYRRVRSARYASHREWMIRSYALMFAAPTLRLWLPLLITAYQGQFLPAYRWVAWVCWVPNIVVAEWYIRRTRGRVLRFGGRERG
jgi:hypothetical protein